MSFWRYNNRVHGLASSKLAIEQQVIEADMVIGAVLIPGAAAPEAGLQRPGRADEAGLGAGRHRGRPGRLLRGHPRDHARRPDVHGAQLDVLLRREHARRGAEHLDVRADQRDAAVRRGAGRQGLAAGAAATTAASRWASTPTPASSPTGPSARPSASRPSRSMRSLAESMPHPERHDSDGQRHHVQASKARVLADDVLSILLDQESHPGIWVDGGWPEARTHALARFGGTTISVWEVSTGVVADIEHEEVFIVSRGRGAIRFENHDDVDLRPGTAIRLRDGDGRMDCPGDDPRDHHRSQNASFRTGH